MLMVIIMITGDFLGMLVTTDNLRQSAKPNSWQIGKLTLACSFLECCLPAFCTAGLLMRPLPIEVVASILSAALLFAFLLDPVKVPGFRRLQLA